MVKNNAHGECYYTHEPKRQDPDEFSLTFER